MINILALVFIVTAYCNCEKCCGKLPSHPAYGITASGRVARAGTVAVDRKVIPLGSRIRIEGLTGTFRAEDTGGAIRGNRIDVWFPTHAEARRFGVQKRKVFIAK